MKPRMLFLTLLLSIAVSLVSDHRASAAESGTAPKRIRDVMWVWGLAGAGTDGPHTPATYAQASPAERSRLLGVDNIVMAGNGLPRNDADAAAWTNAVAHAPRLVWEIMTDQEEGGPPFVYDKTVARVRRLAADHPQIEGVLLDDMSSVGIDHGFKPEHIRNVRELLGQTHEQVKVWGVVYTMNLGREGIADYIRELDVISLWVWHAKDIPQMADNVARIRAMFPDKPVVLGLYLYDYGDGRRMPSDLLEQQCTTALRLAHAGDIEGMVLLTITDDADAVSWTADWIRQVGDEVVGSPAPKPVSTGNYLTLGDGADWRYLGGPWSQDAEGVIRPQDVRNLHSRAFHVGKAYSDLTAEFEFNGNYRETGTGSAGLVIRAQDPDHFYFVYFPWGGQQLRAKHFWAVIAKVDGDGYLRHLAAEWVPSVPSETDRWYRVKVEARGPDIEVWVDGRRAVSVTDDSYASGFAGLAGYGWYAFRNVRIQGAEAAAPPWQDADTIPSHGFTIGLSSDNMPSGCVAPNGDVLIAAGSLLVRSTDRGRSWSEPETLPEKLETITDYGNGMFTSGGKVRVMLYHTQDSVGGPVPEVLMSESDDNGVTWPDPVPSEVAPDWPAQPKSLVPYGPLTENADGVWMRFLLGGVKTGDEPFTDVRTWGSIHCKAYVIRSTDQGKTWSAPIELDRPSWCDAARGTIPGSLDFTEPTGVVIGDTVTVLIRPVYSPYMWQCWSYDGGATWDAAVRATFPGYAQSMVRTSSGAILCAHRYPHYAVNVSRDDGIHWDAGTVIDYPVWAMGTMLEVEPDVVLATYMNANRNEPLLAQLVKVTPDGIWPLKGDAGGK